MEHDAEHVCPQREGLVGSDDKGLIVAVEYFVNLSIICDTQTEG